VSYSQNTFKSKFHLSQRELNTLAQKGVVEIQQSGFYGDSIHHHKIVVVKDEEALHLLLEKTISVVAGAIPTLSFFMHRGSSQVEIKNLEESQILSRLESIEARLRRVERILEPHPSIVSFDWKDFTDRDELLLNTLLQKGRKGLTTPKLARAIGLKKPETSGRSIVYRRLRQIERVSKRLKGSSIVIYNKKRWSLNFDEFSFHIKEEEEK